MHFYYLIFHELSCFNLIILEFRDTLYIIYLPIVYQRRL